MAHPPQTLTEEALWGRPPHSRPSVVSSFTGRSKTPQRTLTWPKWGCSSHSPLPSRLLLGNAWTTGPRKCARLIDKKDQDLPGPSICTTSQWWLGPCGETPPAFQGQNSGLPSGENPERESGPRVWPRRASGIPFCSVLPSYPLSTNPDLLTGLSFLVIRLFLSCVSAVNDSKNVFCADWEMTIFR